MFDNYGLLDVESGTLTLSNSGTSSNASTYSVAAGALLDIRWRTKSDLVGHVDRSRRWHRRLFANGTLNLNPSATLNFDAGLFQWTGGKITGVLTNANVLTISGTNTVMMVRNSQVNNNGLVRHSGTAGLG